MFKIFFFLAWTANIRVNQVWACCLHAFRVFMTSCLYLPPGPWDSSVMPAAGNQQESPLHSRLTGIKPMTKRSVVTSLTTRQHYPQDTISGRYNIRSIQYQVIIMMETQSTCLFSVYTCQSCDVKAPRPNPSVLFKFEFASLSCKLLLKNGNGG